MFSFNATIKTNNGTYYIDQKDHHGEQLFAVMHNSDAIYFGSVVEALNWVTEHSEYHASQTA